MEHFIFNRKIIKSSSNMIWQFDENLKKRKEELINEGYDAYCLFTLAGVELNIAEEINNNYEYCLATPLTKMSHRSHQGRKYNVQEIMLGGYIFLYLKKNFDVYKVRSSKNYFKILSNKNDDGRLYGSDLEYAKWVLDVEGSLSVSEAINLNGKIKIVNGPLKDLEGSIIEYSKRNRNCCIEIDLLGQKIKTWLPFEWIDADISELMVK